MSDTPNPSTPGAKKATKQFGAAFSAGVLLDGAMARFDANRARPWTTAEYERVRRAALALVRSHEAIDIGKTTRAGFDGHAFWALLGALDRETRDPRKGTDS